MRRRHVLALALAGLVPVAPVAGAAPAPILVLANASVTGVGMLAVDQVAAIYLLRRTVWPDGRVIVPINREITSPLRAAFTRLVLRQSPDSLAAYWNEMHFRGRQPPVVQESEAAVLAFIRRVPGAVGYVDGATPVPQGLRLLARIAVPAGGAMP